MEASRARNSPLYKHWYYFYHSKFEAISVLCYAQQSSKFCSICSSIPCKEDSKVSGCYPDELSPEWGERLICWSDHFEFKVILKPSNWDFLNLLFFCHFQVKFAELTLDVYRMLQCLEWEPSGSFYRKHPAEPMENGVAVDYSGASGLIDMNLAADITDPTLPPNPRKAILYRPSLTHLIAVSYESC